MLPDAERMKAIYDAALQRPNGVERKSFIDQECGTDYELRSAIEKLLLEASTADARIDVPSVPNVPVKQIGIRHANPPVSSQSDNPLSGIPRFEVGRRLGSGAFADVYFAHDGKLECPVAVKVLKGSNVTVEARARFLGEARALANVKNVNVVRVIDVVEDAPSPYMVMEYIAGRTLQELIDNAERLGVLEVVEFARQIAEGLAAAHQANRIHRDLSPKNIMIDETRERRRAIIIDFGLAKVIGATGDSGSEGWYGTPNYMSPEQTRGERLTYQSDLFSLGSVVYAMHTGHPPWRGKNLRDVREQIQNMPHPPINVGNQQIPPSLIGVIDRLLAKLPSERYPSAQEAAQAIAKCQEELAEAARLASLVSRPFLLLTSKSPRRRAVLEQVGYEYQHDFMMTDLSPKFDIDSGTLPHVRELVVKKAREKVREASSRGVVDTCGLKRTQTIIVGADTVLWCKERVLDRPILSSPDGTNSSEIDRGRKRASDILKAIRGKEIRVLTGLVVAKADDLNCEASCCVETIAKMQEYSDADIEGYLQSDEPLFLAGACSIQGRGVALFESISGSYSNVVGLPIKEFLELLRDPRFADRSRTLHLSAPSNQTVRYPNTPAISVMALGDINYDLTCDELPEGFFQNLKTPGVKEQRHISRRVGGTAVTFARGARRAGFAECSVLGVIGGDVFGRTIERQLAFENIECALDAEINQETSIAIVLRDCAATDTSVTLTDAKQNLTEATINKAKVKIGEADVLFVSGYALADKNRLAATIRAMGIAKEHQRLVVLDVVVGMSKIDLFREYTNFKRYLQPVQTQRTLVDVLVAEIPDVLRWFPMHDGMEHDFEAIKRDVLPTLGGDFEVVLLRTSNYSHELALFPFDGVPDRSRTDTIECTNGTLKRVVLRTLDYQLLPAGQRLGYADAETTRYLHWCLSPQIVLASASPRRAELLRQLVAINKFEIRNPCIPEPNNLDETPEVRVSHLAHAKATAVLLNGGLSKRAEVVIGADTEIVIQKDGIRRVAGNPKTRAEAKAILHSLSGTVHEAITGVAVIHTQRVNQDGTPFYRVECVNTTVTFRKLSDAEIDAYVLTDEPIGKAGAYGIQGKAALFVERIEGSYSNIVGLPLECLSRMLAKDFGIPIWNLICPACWSSPEDVK